MTHNIGRLPLLWAYERQKGPNIAGRKVGGFQDLFESPCVCLDALRNDRSGIYYRRDRFPVGRDARWTGISTLSNYVALVIDGPDRIPNIKMGSIAEVLLRFR